MEYGGINVVSAIVTLTVFFYFYSGCYLLVTDVIVAVAIKIQRAVTSARIIAAWTKTENSKSSTAEVKTAKVATTPRITRVTLVSTTATTKQGAKIKAIATRTPVA